MMQQYVLLRKDNDLLNSLIGQSFNEKSKFEAYKILKQIHKKADEYSMEKALCYIVDKGEIKGVGGSSLMQNKKTGEIISDLILNNFASLCTGFFTIVDGLNITVGNTVDDGGVARNIRSKFNSAANGFCLVNPNSLGCRLQVGSGSTAPARTDFSIETPFGTAPESAGFNLISNAVYNTSLGNFKVASSITAGGSGTINESVCQGIWRVTDGVTRTFACFRDIISPGQSFIIANTIALEYTVQF